MDSLAHPHTAAACFATGDFAGRRGHGQADGESTWPRPAGSFCLFCVVLLPRVTAHAMRLMSLKSMISFGPTCTPSEAFGRVAAVAQIGCRRRGRRGLPKASKGICGRSNGCGHCSRPGGRAINTNTPAQTHTSPSQHHPLCNSRALCNPPRHFTTPNTPTQCHSATAVSRVSPENFSCVPMYPNFFFCVSLASRVHKLKVCLGNGGRRQKTVCVPQIAPPPPSGPPAYAQPLSP